MSLWKLAMLAILPMLLPRRVWQALASPKIRSWTATMGASLATYLVAYASPYAFLLIDLAAAAIVLMRPAGVAQRSIGALFAVMCFFHIGYIIGGSNDAPTYVMANTVVGWAQWAVLFGWGTHDLGRSAVRWAWPDWRAVDHRAGSGK